jgi:hypothetical protein
VRPVFAGHHVFLAAGSCFCRVVAFRRAITVRESRLVWLALLIGAAAGATGCDLTGQYEANFKKALEKSAQQAKFDNPLNADYHEILDGDGKPIGVKLRLPRLFDQYTQKKTAKELIEDAQKAAGAKGINAKALGAAAMAAQAGYVLQRPVQGEAQPLMVMFMAIPKGAAKGNPAQDLLKPMAAMMPGAVLSDVQLDTPSGQKITLKRLRLSGMTVGEGKQKAAMPPGTLADMYLVDGGSHVVMVNWSAPKSLAEQYQLEQATEAAMGTVEIEAPAAADEGAGKAAGKASP